MSSVKAFVKTHALLLYFSLAFFVSWGAITIIIGPKDVINPWAQTEELLPLVVVTLLFGPTVSSLLMTGIVYGKDGLRDLLSRLVRWKVNARWYLALLIAPLTVGFSVLFLSLFSSAFLLTPLTDESREVSLTFTIVAAFLGGLMEEIGWTGFAIPRMLRSRSVLKTGLVVGFLWGAWHFLPNFWGSANDALDAPLFVFLGVALFSFLPPYRILMTWVYARTKSLLLAVLMHTSLITFWLTFMPATLTGMERVYCFLVWAGVLWALIALINKVTKGSLFQHN